LKIGILSDIHSNKAALEAVLQDLSKEKVSGIIVLGDMLGYYPWAAETYKLLQSQNILGIIKGNHDLLVEEKTADPNNKLEYYEAARLNHTDLEQNAEGALKWLEELKLITTIAVDNCKVTLCHGTPDDPANGRFFPDNKDSYSWFPKKNEILLLGHTHYPLLKKTAEGGIIFNPGSVGQSRDGDPLPSWGLWNVTENSFEIIRTKYDYKAVVNELIAMNWNKRSILALSKDYSGNLNI
jgi:putative phosphoesterase